MHSGFPISERFQEALVLATRLHEGQYRKGTDIPYIAHPLAVCSLVLENGGNEDQAIAALLHDAIEDQGDKIGLEEIQERFGPMVAAIVDGCTDATSFPKPPWRERKEAYLAHLRQATAAERLVAVADKLHNARTILSDHRQLGEAVWKRFTGGKEGTLWYYRGLVKAFRSIEATRLVDELERVVSTIEGRAGRSEDAS
jgi:(p)ppGpp synthase/HD superfamily hydrolase